MISVDIGSLVSALIGVAGLAGVLMVERRDRYRARVDASLASVIQALGRRAVALDEDTRMSPELGTLGNVWKSQIREAPGGPVDAELQSAVEVAGLAARRRCDRRGVQALAQATFDLKAAPVRWQIERAGRIAADVRWWRSGWFRLGRFIRQMEAVSAEALDAGETFRRSSAG